jgi:AcrR family transcriptional regulator
LGTIVIKQRVRRLKTDRKRQSTGQPRTPAPAARVNGKAAAKRGSRPRVRLDPDARAAMILEAAVAFFAEHGFDAQVRDLSDRLGVSQGLIFRYFGTKRILIERVYQRVYVARWSDEWEQLLQDRSIPLKSRLIDFYKSYLAAVDDFEWIRVSLFSGLAGYDLTRRYVMTRVEGLLKIIMVELRKLGPADALPSRSDELHEIVWHLHSTFIYYLIRKYVFGIPVIKDRNAFVNAVVSHFMAGFNPEPIVAERASGSGQMLPLVQPSVRP